MPIGRRDSSSLGRVLLKKNWEIGEYRNITDEYKRYKDMMVYGEDKELFYVYEIKNKVGEYYINKLW